MKNTKQILIITLSAVLLGAIIFLTYIFTSGSSISLFNLRAANPQEEVDTFLAENNLAPTALPPSDDGVEEESLLAYNSTSPSPTLPPADAVSGSPSPTPFEANQGIGDTSPTPSGTETKGGLSLTPTITPTMSLTPTPTEFIEITGGMSPTVVTQLPVAGITDNLGPVLIGGGALILLAFLL